MDASNLSQERGSAAAAVRWRRGDGAAAARPRHVPNPNNYSLRHVGIAKSAPYKKPSKLHPRMIFAMITLYPHKSSGTCPERQTQRTHSKYIRTNFFGVCLRRRYPRQGGLFTVRIFLSFVKSGQYFGSNKHCLDGGPRFKKCFMLTKGKSGKSRDIFRSIYRFIQNALVVSEVTADMKYGIIVTKLNKVDLHTNECRSARGPHCALGAVCSTVHGAPLGGLGAALWSLARNQLATTSLFMPFKRF